jgi:hypothetical protein
MQRVFAPPRLCYAYVLFSHPSHPTEVFSKGGFVPLKPPKYGGGCVTQGILEGESPLRVGRVGQNNLR